MIILLREIFGLIEVGVVLVYLLLQVLLVFLVMVCLRHDLGHPLPHVGLRTALVVRLAFSSGEVGLAEVGVQEVAVLFDDIVH